MNSAIEKDQQKQSGTFAIKTSTQNLFENSGNRITSNSIDNIRALTYLQMVCFTKKNWELLLTKKVTTQCFPSAMNKQTNVGYRHKRVSSE